MVLHNRSQLPGKHDYTEHGNQEVWVLPQVVQAFHLHIYILYILLIHVSHCGVIELPNILYVIDLAVSLYHYDKHMKILNN